MNNSLQIGDIVRRSKKFCETSVEGYNYYDYKEQGKIISSHFTGFCVEWVTGYRSNAANENLRLVKRPNQEEGN